MVTEIRTAKPARHEESRLTSDEVKQLLRSISDLNQLKVCSTHLAELKAFMKGVKYAGKALPIAMTEKTFDRLELILAFEQCRLEKEKAAVEAGADAATA